MIGQRFESRATGDVYIIAHVDKQTITLAIGTDRFDVPVAKFDRWVIEGDIKLIP